MAEGLRALRRVFANPSLRRLQLAELGSGLGHFAYFLAIAIYAFDAGGAELVGLAAVVRAVPTGILTPFAATLGDRYPRRLVMVGSDLSRALVLVVAAVAISSSAPPAVVIGLSVVAAIATSPFETASAALTPALARTTEELTAANVASSTIASIATFAGPALGGILLAATDPSVGLLASAGTLVWSAACVLGVREPERKRTEGADGEAGKSSLWSETTEGFRTLRDEPNLLVPVLLIGAVTFVLGALTVLWTVLGLELLDAGDAGLGYLYSAMGIGALVGAFGTLGLVGKRGLGGTFGIGLILWGIPIALCGVFVSLPAAVALSVAIGFANTIADVSSMTLLQRLTPEQVLARVFGVLEALLVGALALGALVAPWLIDLLGAETAIVVTGAMLPALALIALPRLRALDAALPPPSRELELLESLPPFAPLAPPALEELAARLQTIRFAAGETIVRQGEPGDRFYVVSDGEVDVEVDGRHVDRQGPGSHFGEIALLRDVPRTATVTAHGNVELYALEREDFLDAVSGSAPSSAAAEAVIGYRLARARPAGLAV
jgi:MFS family permease